ncbi:MAG: cation:proton antiporter [Candidatus Gracilibacteria bacterium]|nr:cation:proton antiporter [Candidatus Gracilibacteria bacterium]
MESAAFINGTLSFLTLLTISIFTYLLSQKIKLPYTVLLIIVGLFLVPIAGTEMFGFIDDFKLTPGVLFYVFLPVLLFESAYNINYRKLIRNWRSIFALSVFGLLISMFTIGFGLYYILPFLGFNVPFIICLLFGSVISATDPVAVLALFKTIGAPRRLALIFEGESLFNDGTAYAFFSILLVIILKIGETAGAFQVGLDTVLHGFFSFLSMAIGGMLFGGFMGVLFSKIIGKIKNNEVLEISLTMVLAHLTFLLAEIISHNVIIGHFHLQLSGIIATTMAGIVVGNYGKCKITPSVESYMHHFWEFFAYLANSIVFILLGLTVSHIQHIDFGLLILPTIVAILVIIIARMISVYIPIGILNKFKLEREIPTSWQHLLAWGSLRGALALVLIMMVPEDLTAFQTAVGWDYAFSIKDFLLVLSINAIFFTMFVKALTIAPMMRKFNVGKLTKLEEFEYSESSILISLKALEKLENLHKKGYVAEEEYKILKLKYEEKQKRSIKSLKQTLKNSEDADKLIKKAISLHALGIEKKALNHLLTTNEINVGIYKYLMHKIEKQIIRVELGKPQLKTIIEKNSYDFFEKLVRLFSSSGNCVYIGYLKNRTKIIISNKVIRELKKFKEYDFGFENYFFDEIIELYERFNNIAENRMKIEAEENDFNIELLDSKLVDKSLLRLEGELIEDLYKKDMITPKLYHKLKEEIEGEFYKEVVE